MSVKLISFDEIILANTPNYFPPLVTMSAAPSLLILFPLSLSSIFFVNNAKQTILRWERISRTYATLILHEIGTIIILEIIHFGDGCQDHD